MHDLAYQHAAASDDKALAVPDRDAASEWYGEVPTSSGESLELDDVVDFELCFAYNFSDPYGNQIKLNCYEHEPVEPCRGRRLAAAAVLGCYMFRGYRER